MKKLLPLLFLLSAITVFSQQYPDYYSQNRFGLTSPGAMKYGLYGYVNPAVLSTLDQPDLLFTWNVNKGEDWNAFNNWGLFAALPNFGFGAVTQKFGGAAVTDFKLSSAFGNESFSLGLGYGWSSGHQDYFRRSALYTAGLLIRPAKYFSLGLISNFARSSSEYVVDAAVRPLGSEIISVFADYVYRENRLPGEIKWSAGASIEALPGIRVVGRYFDNKFFNAGLDLSFGRIGIFSNSSFNDNGDYASNVYGIRAGAYDRNIIPKLYRSKEYVEMNLLGSAKYQRFKFFDNTSTLSDILTQIEAAKDDEFVSGIAINTSGMTINREMLWEIRQKLLQFKSAGKKVFVYVDRTGLDGYHFASVADKIVMDPQGMITLEGMIMGRQYYKETLAKLGIGFTEWRYFKYKSALESFSEERMTAADREQRLALVDDFYELARNDISRSRRISADKFDELVNNEVMIMPSAALKSGLADTLGRWDTVLEMVKRDGGDKPRNPKFLEKFLLPGDNYWGRKPEVAVIYAIGACAMDEGINARQLVKDVKRAVENNNIKAIVLRVDSPGGDGLASDIVAEELKKALGKKPVIVSQGYVAASGGYWLSMYSDAIVAAPNTITGSIGVIGGWAYNIELKEKLGITTDYVKRGNHADLGFGFTVPLIGLTLPDRDLTTEEQQKAESLITTMYTEFVQKVADGRNVSYDKIEGVAQGRVWSGVDGLNNGLIDVLGGLDDAIKLAVNKAGLKEGEYSILELPEPGMFDLNFLMPKLIGFDYKEDPSFKTLKLRLQHNGQPMPMLPLEDALDWEMKMGR